MVVGGRAKGRDGPWANRGPWTEGMRADGPFASLLPQGRAWGIDVSEARRDAAGVRAGGGTGQDHGRV